MTGQHRKPSPERSTFLVRPVDADRVREAIADVAAKAINETRLALVEELRSLLPALPEAAGEVED